MCLQIPRGVLGESPLIVRRHDPADDRGGGLHHQAADFLAQLGQHLLVFLRRRLVRLGHDLFGGRNRPLRFLFLHRFAVVRASARNCVA